MDFSVEEELSAGYLDNDGGEEDEYELNSNNISPKPQSMMTITTGKSPDVNRYKIKLKAAELPAISSSQEKIYTTNKKTSLGVSNSQKVIENKNGYMESSASKKSLQLSDSCPKENLVRHMYQRPGVLKSIEGLNSRLRSLSIKRSHEHDSDSATNQYQMNQLNSGQIKIMSRENSVSTLLEELQQNQKKTENFNPVDSYAQHMPVYLCKSPFTGRPPTVWFQYPPGVSE